MGIDIHMYIYSVKEKCILQFGQPGRTQEYLFHSWWFVSRNEAVSE
ncbi:unnamed protein product [Brassica napus]|uniref:(rape) hypothetical protein n=1 Tax=Brassica napus TaxID=3708 RepID=A0A816S4S2_BRANA|nr:unnamed protein product [Brassica napus]